MNYQPSLLELEKMIVSFYDKFRNNLVHEGFSRLGNLEDANDVVGSTLHRAIKYRKSFNLSKGNNANIQECLKNWIFGILRNEIINKLRETDRSHFEYDNSDESYTDIKYTQTYRNPTINFFIYLKPFFQYHILDHKDKLILYHYYQKKKSQDATREILSIGAEKIRDRIKKIDKIMNSIHRRIRAPYNINYILDIDLKDKKCIKNE